MILGTGGLTVEQFLQFAGIVAAAVGIPAIIIYAFIEDARKRKQQHEKELLEMKFKHEKELAEARGAKSEQEADKP